MVFVDLFCRSQIRRFLSLFSLHLYTERTPDPYTVISPSCRPGLPDMPDDTGPMPRKSILRGIWALLPFYKDLIPQVIPDPAVQ